jgi:hypothetical protein
VSRQRRDHADFEGSGDGIRPEPCCSGDPFGICHYLEGIAAFEGTTGPRPWELKRHRRTGDRTVVSIGHLDDWLTVRAAQQIVDGAFPFDYCQVQFGWRALRPERNYTEIAGHQQDGQNVPEAHCPPLRGKMHLRSLLGITRYEGTLLLNLGLLTETIIPVSNTDATSF